MGNDQPSGQIATLQTRQADVLAMFNANKGQFVKIAPSKLDPQRLMYIAYTTIVQNPKLLLCTRESLLAGCVESIKLGLQLGGPMQEAHLIPYGNKATLVIGFMGYRSLIDRSGSVKALHPYAVHNGLYGNDQRAPDEFDYWLGDEPRVIHKPRNPFPEKKEQLACVYVVAHLRGGGKQFEVLMPEEIESHRKRSRAANDGPWVTDYVPMALKTAVRKIAKYLPKATLPMGIADAIAIDDRADRGEDTKLPDGFVLPPAPETSDAGAAPLASQTDRVRERLGGAPATKPAESAPAATVSEDDIEWGGGTNRPG
jgi:phage RecT family recombinase